MTNVFDKTLNDDVLSDRAVCEAFALKHKVIFDDAGTCGFGRECVGFSSGGNWIDHNPCLAKDYMPIDHLKSDATWAPDGVDAYHKHDCLAVLGRGPEAIAQLASWVRSMESKGVVQIVEYDTGATGIQAMISGFRGRAVIVRPFSEIGE